MNTDDVSPAAPLSSASEEVRPLDLPQSAPAAQESLHIEENVPSYTPQSMLAVILALILAFAGFYSFHETHVPQDYPQSTQSPLGGSSRRA